MPTTVFDQSEGLVIARSLCCPTREQETWLPTMYQGTGIEHRHMVLPRALVDDVVQGTAKSGSVFLPTGCPDDRGPTTGQRMECYQAEASPLAARACKQALSEAGLEPKDLTHLITVSCTGFAAPGVDSFLIQEMGLAATIQRTHVGFMGCHGALNGLRVASAFSGADPQARVLLCAVELCSLHYFYGWDPGRMIANAIFADGAAALIGAPSSKALPSAWKIAAAGSCLFPGTKDAMTWSIGDHGFVMSLSKKVPGLIAVHLRPWLESWLRSVDTTLADIRSWAIHPGGPRILGAVEESLGLTADQTVVARETFAIHGNMSSPTILFILDRLRRKQAPRPCLALGFGPGLAVEAMLFR